MPKKDPYANDPLGRLKEKRDALQERYDDLKTKARVGVGRFGLWSVLGTAAFVADMTFLGGLGTVFALGGGAAFFGNNSEAKKIGRQLKQMEETILKLEEAQAIENIKLSGEAAKKLYKNLNAEFSPSAQKQIDALQKQLADVTRKLDEIQNPPPLDKPRRPF